MTMLLRAVVLVSVWVVCGLAQAQTVLKFNSWLPSTHPIVAMTVKPWTDEVAKVTQGRVRFEFTASGLGPPPSQFDLVRDGVADAALTVHGYTPARFPLMQIGELPFLAGLSEPLSVALWRVDRQFFTDKKESAGTHVMAIFASQPGRVFTVGKKLESIGDWQGLKLAGGAAINVEEAKALGAVGLRAPGPQAAEMTKRGTADGLFIDVSSFTDFSLGGTIKHMLDFPRGIHAATFTLIVNEGKWKAIAAADQAAIEKISGETLSRTAGRNWDEAAARARVAFPPAGVEVNMITPEHQQALDKRLRFLEDEWLNKARATGVDGKAALAELRRIVAGYPGK